MKINSFGVVLHHGYSTKKLYSIFRNLLLQNTDEIIAQATIYLLDETIETKKELLLGCIADLELELNNELLIQTIISFLASENIELARSAALALVLGGQKSADALHDACLDLNVRKYKDIEQYLSFVHNNLQELSLWKPIL